MLENIKNSLWQLIDPIMPQKVKNWIEPYKLKDISLDQLKNFSELYKKVLLAKKNNNEIQKAISLSDHRNKINNESSEHTQKTLEISNQAFNTKYISINNTTKNFNSLRDKIATSTIDVINVTQRELLNNFIALNEKFTVNNFSIQKKFMRNMKDRIPYISVEHNQPKQFHRHIASLFDETITFNQYLSILLSALNTAIENDKQDDIKEILEIFENLARVNQYTNMNWIYEIATGKSMFRETFVKMITLGHSNISNIAGLAGKNIEFLGSILQSINSPTNSDGSKKTLVEIILQPENINSLVNNIVENIKNKDKLHEVIKVLTFDRFKTDSLKTDFLDNLNELKDIINNNTNNLKGVGAILEKFIWDHVKDENLKNIILKPENFSIFTEVIKGKTNKKDLRNALMDFIDDKNGKVFIKNKDTIKVIDDMIAALRYDNNNKETIRINITKFNLAITSAMDKWENLNNTELKELNRYETAKSKNESLTGFSEKLSDPKYKDELNKAIVSQKESKSFFTGSPSLFSAIVSKFSTTESLAINSDKESREFLIEIISNPFIHGNILKLANLAEPIAYYQGIFYDALKLVDPEKSKDFSNKLMKYLEQLADSFGDEKNKNKKNSEIFMQEDNFIKLFEILEIISVNLTDQNKLNELDETSFFRDPMIQNLMIIVKEVSKNNAEPGSVMKSLSGFLKRSYLGKIISTFIHWDQTLDILMKNPVIFQSLIKIENHIVENTIKTIDKFLMPLGVKQANDRLNSLQLNQEHSKELNGLKEDFKVMESYYGNKTQNDSNNYIKNYKAVVDHASQMKERKIIYTSSLTIATAALVFTITIAALPVKTMAGSTKIGAIIPLLMMAILAMTLAVILIKKNKEVDRELADNVLNESKIVVETDNSTQIPSKTLERTKVTEPTITKSTN